MKHLGAIGADLGAVACFFAKPWTVLAPEVLSIARGWLLNEAAIRLRAQGRLTEAVEPMRTGLNLCIGDWLLAAQAANNLSELELARGEISAAITAGEQAVTYADLSGRAIQKMNCRTTLADTLHQAGRRADAGRLFKDAEVWQAERQPEHRQRFSLAEFRHYSFLLSEAEHAAWQRLLTTLPADHPRESSQGALAWLGETRSDEASLSLIAACSAVSERARGSEVTSRELFVTEPSLLNIGLHHLTLAQVELYKSTSIAPTGAAEAEITAAVKNLRTASAMHHLPRGLLTRAWLRYLSGNKVGCHEDLDEAWEIAERGPMPLFQADIQLTRARLFRDRAALAEARRLIEKHGYHRRDGELEDAEAAARGWEETKPIQSSESLQAKPGLELNEDSMRDQVFISYSHRDKRLMEEFQIQLKPYLRARPITVWSDKQIASGAKWFDEIQAALAKTSVAVLLVSPDFLASDFIHEHELGPLLKEAEAGGVKILWVLLRECAYKETPLKDYQAVVSPPAKPLAEMKAERARAWVRICEEIKNAVNP